MTFADRLRQLVEAEVASEKTSQSVVAARMNLSGAALGNYLNGRIPKTEEMLRIAAHYKVSVEWLMTGKGSNFGAPSAEALQVRDEIAEKLKQLPDGQRELIGQFIDMVLTQNAVLSRLHPGVEPETTGRPNPKKVKEEIEDDHIEAIRKKKKAAITPPANK